MRINSLRCACAPGTHPLDHYSSGACRKLPMPLPRIAGILASVQGDTAHRDGKITATRVLTCARQVIIEDNIATSFDVTGYNSIYDGIIEHEAMQRHAPPGTYTEQHVAGRLFGVEMEGTIDFVTADLREIHDYKKHSEMAQKFKLQRGGADPELAAQLNIYRLLLEQSVEGAKVEKLRVWHGAMVSAGSVPAWFETLLPLVSEEEISRLKPHGGNYTVQQIVDAYVGFAEETHGSLIPTDAEVGLEPGPGLEAAIKRVPLQGRGMWGGKKCNLYCPVREACDRIEGITRL